MKTVRTSHKNVKCKNQNLFAVILCLSIFLFLRSVGSAEDPVKRIQNAYKDLQDMKGEFTQKSYFKDLEKTENFNGKFFLKKPGMMRWIYLKPKSQELIINKGRLLIIDRDLKQAMRSDFNRNLYGQTPVALLEGFGNIEKDFNIKEKHERLIELIPKESMGSITKLLIELNIEGFAIKTFKVYDIYGNTIEITIKSVSVNHGIDNSAFTPDMKGINLYEHNI